ncbi:MAG: SulP family inorganic anion transporter [Lachnospira sp.]
MENTLKKHIDKKNIKNDILAGIIVALVSIPISMGYASLAGLPVVYGLYGSLLPVLIYGLTTSSPQFVFGVDATPAVLVGGTLASLGIVGGSREAMELVPVITLVVAAWLLLFSVVKAGRIVNYISTPVMGGFISGIGITIILMQVPKLFGGNPGTGELFELLVHIILEFDSFNILSAVLGIATVVIILISKKISPKFPMSVILMGVGALSTAIFHIDRYGVKLLPKVEAGLPKFVVPDLTLLKNNTEEIIILGLTVALVIMAQTLLATNNYANRYGYKVNNNREVFAYSVSNVASAFMGCCPLNGSVSRTGIADQFGCKSQIMSITAALTMLLVVLFGTPLLQYLPVPVLTGIVIAALIGIIENKLAAKLWKVNRTEFFIFMAAMFGVLLLGTIYGVVIGIVLSFIAVIIRAVVPPTTFLGVIPGHEGFYNIKRNRNAREIEHTIIYRFSGTLFFANIATLQKEIEDAIQPDTRQVIVDASGIGSIDITAADRLLTFNKMLKEKNIKFYITEHVGNVNDQLRTLGAGSLVEEGVTRRTISLALRDAGVMRPYPLVGEAVSTEDTKEFIEDNERLAEIEWAFGKDADEWLEKAAVRVVDDISKSNETTEDIILHAENSGEWGRIGLFDEDELLERVEMRLFAMAQYKDHNPEEIEKRIEERRLKVEEKIAKLNPEAIKTLHEHRDEVLARFKQNNPEGYRYMMERRKEHVEKLAGENPELAKKMKLLYHINDGEEDSEKETGKETL